MADCHPKPIAEEILALEGLYLDRQQWDPWLELYPEDIEYWLPAWKSESALVDNVQREVSLIYHTRRNELAERILRIRSRKSVTAMPLPRTAHFVSNVLASAIDNRAIEGTASWMVHEYDPRVSKQHVLFGRYEFTLRHEAATAGNEHDNASSAGWKIARKKIILLNDVIPTVIDFYNI